MQIFNAKYLKIIFEIFNLDKTLDHTFGVFSWEYSPDLVDEIKLYFTSELDSKINNIKNNCLIFVNCLFNKSRKEIKNQENVQIIYQLIKIGLSFFEFLTNNRLQYFKYFNSSLNASYSKNNKLPSHFYESLIYQYLVLFANVINVKPFSQDLQFDIKK